MKNIYYTYTCCNEPFLLERETEKTKKKNYRCAITQHNKQKYEIFCIDKSNIAIKDPKKINIVIKEVEMKVSKH